MIRNTLGFKIVVNGITVTQEYGHYLLQKNGVKMRCDVGELNECIQEFEDYFRRNNTYDIDQYKNFLKMKQ